MPKMALPVLCFEFLLFLFYASMFSLASSCGGELHASTDGLGYINTPNYPKPYEWEITCKWIIEAPAGYVVQLEFLDFDVESANGNCETDTVQVHNGQDDEHSPLLGEILCGKTVQTLTGSEPFMSVIFKSDFFSLGRSKGFNASYKAVPMKNDLACLTTVCGGQIDDTISCSILSPGYPAQYDILNCSWYINAPKHDQKISVKFLEMNFNAVNSLCEKNNVTFYNVNDKKLKMSQRVCDMNYNRLTNRPFISDGPSIMIKLITSRTSLSSSSPVNGFHLKFEVVDQEGNAITQDPSSSSITTNSEVSTIASASNASTSLSTKSTSTSTSTTITTSTVTPTTTSANTGKTLTTSTKVMDSIMKKIASAGMTTTTTLQAEKATKELKMGRISKQDIKPTSDSFSTSSHQNTDSLTPSSAAMSGLVIGIIVALVTITMIIVLLVAYAHWKKKTGRMNRRLREADARSDVNTLLSSIDSREFDDMKKKDKQRRQLTMEERVTEENNLNSDFHSLL